MASFGATASASASVANNVTKCSTYLPFCHRHFQHSHSKVAFRITTKPKLRLFAKGLQSNLNRSAVARAQLNEVAVDGPTNTVITASSESAAESNDAKSTNEPPSVASEETISAFMSQVSDLVKLVDSRDIVELQLKQLDCELLIRKKDALPPPPAAAPVMFAPAHHLPPPMAPSPPPVPASGPASPPAAKPAPALVAKSTKSSHPPLKSPMAGTFYRSPGPGEPPFVKVGDNVKKGQVLCIVEAMKLMNEIEADQTGTIVEVLAEDGKSVSVDTPLFVIEPQ